MSLPTTTFAGLALVAGDPALDFVNSVEFRGRAAAGERLVSYAALAGWAEAAQIVTPDEALGLLGDASLLQEALHLRETFRAFLDTPGEGALAASLAAQLSRASQRQRLDLTGGRLRQTIPLREPSDLLRRIEATIARFLTDWDPARVRACAAEDCDWVFVDRTKAGRRRWCDSRTCGNRARVRRFRKGNDP